MDAEETVCRVQISRRRVDGRDRYDAVWSVEEVPDQVVYHLLDHIGKCFGGSIRRLDGFTAISHYGEFSFSYEDVEFPF